MMNYYPEQLRRIAEICEALNKIDGVDAPEDLQLEPVRLIDSAGIHLGTLRDEIGGAWSFFPVVNS